MNLDKIKESARSALPHLKDPWVLSWIITGLLAILIPVITWSSNRGTYYSAYGYAKELEDLEKQQEEYYNQQQEENDGNDGDDGNNYYSYYKECGWLNWSCKKKQYYYATAEEREKQAENGEAVQMMPDWYILLGGYENSEEMQKWKEENTGVRQEGQFNGASGGMKFVYFSTLIIFVSLLVFGGMSIAKKQDSSNLLVFLVLAAVVSFMNLISAGQSLIGNDDKEFEDSYYGWFGQMGVLMVYFNFYILLFSVGHLIAFRVKSYLANKATEKDGNDDGAYKQYDDKQEAKLEHEIQMT